MDPEIVQLKNILLVEDDPRDVELTLAVLQEDHLGRQVTVVEDGAQALDYLYRRGKFNLRAGPNPILVLLDNKMPKVSGLEVLKAIKADERLKMIPVVALTSSRESVDLIAFYRNGVNAYVVKPLGFSEFKKAIKQIGLFWASLNESAASLEGEESQVTRGVHISSASNGSDHKTAAPRPARAG